MRVTWSSPPEERKPRRFLSARTIALTRAAEEDLARAARKPVCVQSTKPPVWHRDLANLKADTAVVYFLPPQDG